MPKDFIRFIIVGIGSNILNYSAYILLFIVWVNIPIASAIGYIFGLIFSYYLGKTWAFKTNSPKSQGINFPEVVRFCIIYGVGGVGMIFINDALVTQFDIDYRISWFFGATFAFFNNYFGSKWIVYK